MQFGIYYAYWADKWGVDYLPFVDKVADLGYDILEISLATVREMTDAQIDAMNERVAARGISLSGGYGPKESQNLASPDEKTVSEGFRFWEETFRVMQKLGITNAVGGLYSYWPVDFAKPFDKAADWERSVNNMKKLADMAAGFGVTTLGMEVLNRHEGYMINTAKEAVAYCKAVDKPNVKVHIDTYHMLLEEDSFTEAIHTAGDLIGHVHVGENNRRLPGQGHITNWKEIAQALKDVHYDGRIVAEPFVIHGGEVGRDVRLWRDLLDDQSEQQLDKDAKASLAFLKETFSA